MTKGRMTRRICLALDLVDDADLIADYERWHRPGEAPVEVVRSIHEAGIAHMEIDRAGNRLFMIIDDEDHYSDEAKARAADANPPAPKWITRMPALQQPIPPPSPPGQWMDTEIPTT